MCSLVACMNKDRINFPEHIARRKESGLSMAAYCKEYNLNYQTFTYHASRMKKKEAESNTPKSFIRIDVPEKTSATIEYHFAQGGYFVFPVGCPVQLIKTLIN